MSSQRCTPCSAKSTAVSPLNGLCIFYKVSNSSPIQKTTGIPGSTAEKYRRELEKLYRTYLADPRIRTKEKAYAEIVRTWKRRLLEGYSYMDGMEVAVRLRTTEEVASTSTDDDELFHFLDRTSQACSNRNEPAVARDSDEDLFGASQQSQAGENGRALTPPESQPTYISTGTGESEDRTPTSNAREQESQSQPPARKRKCGKQVALRSTLEFPGSQGLRQMTSFEKCAFQKAQHLDLPKKMDLMLGMCCE